MKDLRPETFEELEELLKLMMKYNVSQYAQGEFGILMRKPPAAFDSLTLKEPPRKTKEQEEEELLFYSSRG